MSTNPLLVKADRMIASSFVPMLRLASSGGGAVMLAVGGAGIGGVVPGVTVGVTLDIVASKIP